MFVTCREEILQKSKRKNTLLAKRELLRLSSYKQKLGSSTLDKNQCKLVQYYIPPHVFDHFRLRHLVTVAGVLKKTRVQARDIPTSCHVSVRNGTSNKPWNQEGKQSLPYQARFKAQPFIPCGTIGSFVYNCNLNRYLSSTE